MNKFFRFFAFLILFLTPACNSDNSKKVPFTKKSPKNIHIAHLSNGWYPQNKEILNKQLNNFFNFAYKNFNMVINPYSIKALIVPHAGYYYSGICAACAYQNLFENKKSFEKNTKIKKVIILAPNHTTPFQGISLPKYDTYQTVFGDINVDKKSIELLKKEPIFKAIPKTHFPEHSIEIQLPFLQKAISSFEIIPLVIGFINSNEYDSIANALAQIIDDSTLIIISSDFIHYGSSYGYKPFDDNIFFKIRYIDSLVINSIRQQSFENFSNVLNNTAATICGQNAIKILLKLLQLNILKDLQTRIACYYTTPQIEKMHATTDDKQKSEILLKNIDDNEFKNSVSYLSLIFTTEKLKDLEKQNQLTDFEKQALLTCARDTLKNYFKNTSKKIEEHLLWPIPSLGIMQNKGAFVTLNTKDGNLKGCIGKIVAEEPLFATVQRMVKQSAFHDERFTPLKKNELENIIIDISVLTPPKNIDNYNDIKIGKHGIILQKFISGKGLKSAVFLPQVPVSFGWDLQTTLEHLSTKAGLTKDAWKNDCKFQVFESFEISE
ncbi:AmmeMemoRadiSam system protein B [Candidatus Dependentiae bacterium]|nr:AmmeMemoRadiSam system protein B [Candidatus Dependentiae bacterium]